MDEPDHASEQRLVTQQSPPVRSRANSPVISVSNSELRKATNAMQHAADAMMAATESLRCKFQPQQLARSSRCDSSVTTSYHEAVHEEDPAPSAFQSARQPAAKTYHPQQSPTFGQGRMPSRPTSLTSVYSLGRTGSNAAMAIYVPSGSQPIQTSPSHRYNRNDIDGQSGTQALPSAAKAPHAFGFTDESQSLWRPDTQPAHSASTVPQAEPPLRASISRFDAAHRRPVSISTALASHPISQPPPAIILPVPDPAASSSRDPIGSGFAEWTAAAATSTRPLGPRASTSRNPPPSFPPSKPSVHQPDSSMPAISVDIANDGGL